METTYQNESNVIVNSQEPMCCAITTKNTRCKMKVKWKGNEGAWHGVCLCQRHYNMGLQNIRTIYDSNASQILKKKNMLQRQISFILEKLTHPMNTPKMM